MPRYQDGGCSGQSYDRSVYQTNLSTVNKIQRDFWTVKQVFRKKMGKEDDQFVVASDAEIDAKLDLFYSVQTTCHDLLKAIEKYQACISVLSRNENDMGQFLREQGEMDKTSAGKMMIAVGKAQCFTSQQRMALRDPLSRLYGDVETFRVRAITDSALSVNNMEEARTHYRASLRWMQENAKNLDPEQYKKLEKFRKVQSEVRLNKEKFDRLKWAVCQKVDLLCASRSNLFSVTLVPYQNEMIKFWKKVSNTLAAVVENIAEYKTYQFKLLKDLNPITDEDLEEHRQTEEDSDNKEEKDNSGSVDDSQLINFESEGADENRSEQQGTNGDLLQPGVNSTSLADEASLINLNSPFKQKSVDSTGDSTKTNEKNGATDDGDDFLLTDVSSTDANNSDDLLNDIFGGQENGESSDFERQWESVFGEFEQSAPVEHSQPPQQLLNDFSGMMMNSKEQSNTTAATDDAVSPSSGYLPSQLLDLMSLQDGNAASHPNQPAASNNIGNNPAGGMMSNFNLFQSKAPSMGGKFQPPSYSSMFGSNSSTPAPNGPVPHQNQGNDKTNMSSWLDLFAELDPLQNPDALKKTEGRKQSDGGAC